ncbi:N-fatty-acyl-amino acid synthase/hydrolase PM20D1 [Spea bombifrons]|uniref:N-fatty-acyl-amino acid synthase/hydrolase PM20D1 n=1 Tax=Spea bombifrons TaxID=233779 RepID=UPI002349ACD3|nr:N-fatty-acyl-amino acid synthase/hydrolase PM20D1 [Spea bombifrons]XP_053313687.1 N-fatty-acyl-amino acid synthase/hydrolase PM20D1 [Spea bombifrons]
MDRVNCKGLVGPLVWSTVAGLGLLVTVLLIRTYTLPESVGVWESEGAPGAQLGEDERRLLTETLRGAIRIPTVSFSEDHQNTTALAEFGEYIKKVFPRVFSSDLIKHEVVGGYSHLFTIQGTDKQLLPYMLLAHLDVVPATHEGWEVPPFDGGELDGYIYGRGTLDDKNCVIGILQALEFLLKRGYKPRRPFYIGIGHDEEVSGHKGAMKIVEKLQSQGIKLAFVLDEGLAVLDGVIQGIRRPIALVGTTEKGSITLNLTVDRQPGHSSMPPPESSIGILSAAVSRLEQNPMPNMFGEGPESSMFEQLAGEFVFPLNVLMANLWLFSPVISRILERTPSSNAMVRTTTALTMFNAGIKSNVIPPTARATINFRLHPAQTVKQALDIVRNTIRDERVVLSVVNSFDPLPVSPYDDENFGYQTLKRTIQAVFSGAPVAPGVCVGNTDSRHFVNLTDSTYRFSPVVMKPEDISRIHGLNERISFEGFERVVQFYFQFIQNSDSDKVPRSHRATHEL